MARRTSGFEQLIGLPWWLSLSLGVIAYIVLKFVLPSIPFESAVFSAYGKAGQSVAGAVLMIFCFASVLSLFLQLKKGWLVDGQSGVDSIKDLSWKEFEYLISEAFRRQGYFIEENLRAGADGGVDLVLRTIDQRIFVQCKNWKNSTVGVTVVRELFGVVKAEGADQGCIVCSGRYTRDAIEFANKSGIRLIGSDELCKMISGVQKSGRMRPIQSNPNCPRCGAEMIQRVARKGKDIGKSFWGCAGYPKCRGTLD